MTYAPGWDCDMHCVRSSAHLRLRTRAHKLVFTPRIVIETNSPAHAESSPHVRRTLDINRESDIHAVAGTLQTPISIHALREENDPGTLRLTKRSKNFNPHSPCGERRHQHLQRARTQDFNPHSPCGERLPSAGWKVQGQYFNPHSPCGERLADSISESKTVVISIHTPLAGSDYWWFRAFRPSRNFNPHSPCGERHNPHCCLGRLKYFNPHSPCGERRVPH